MSRCSLLLIGTTRQGISLALLTLALLALVGAPRRLPAQDAAARPVRPTPPPLRPLPADLLHFFSGRWDCAGANAAGRRMEAEVAFAPVLDSSWMEYRHTDRAPGTYTAVGMWGMQVDGKLVQVLHGQRGSLRRFNSEGWDGQSVTFTADTTFGQGRWPHRFIYRVVAPTRFRMGYEVWRDGAWKLGDSVTCSRG